MCILSHLSLQIRFFYFSSAVGTVASPPLQGWRIFSPSLVAGLPANDPRLLVSERIPQLKRVSNPHPMTDQCRGIKAGPLHLNSGPSEFQSSLWGQLKPLSRIYHILTSPSIPTLFPSLSFHDLQPQKYTLVTFLYAHLHLRIGFLGNWTFNTLLLQIRKLKFREIP